MTFLSFLAVRKARRFLDCHYKLKKGKQASLSGYYPGMNLNKIAMENNKKKSTENPLLGIEGELSRLWVALKA